MKQIRFALIITTFAALVLAGCSNYGKEKQFNGVQLFYTSAIQEALADKLGIYLTESGFADGNRKTIQIAKTGNTYEFRMVIKKGIEQDKEYLDNVKIYASELSKDVFDGSQVDIHLCDEHLKTLRVVVF